MIKLFDDIFDIINTKIRVSNRLILRASNKYFYKDIQYFIELKKIEKANDLVLKIILKKKAKTKTKQFFINRIINDEKFRNKYFRVYKLPVKHICFLNHIPTSYVKKMFNNIDELFNIMCNFIDTDNSDMNQDNNTENNDIDNTSINGIPIDFIINKYNLIIE